MIVNQAALDGIARSFSAIFNKALANAPSIWDQVAMKMVSTGRSIDYKMLARMSGMKRWVTERQIGNLTGFHYELVNDNWEDTIEVDRNDIEDDQIGLYGPHIQNLATTAISHRDLLTFAALNAGFASTCIDGQYFFDTDHQVGSASVSNTGGGSGTPWFLLDCSRPIKPLILQIRKEPEFVAQNKSDDEQAFVRRQFRYGVDDRKVAGYGPWQLAYGSKQTLDTTAYAAGVAAMQGLKDDAGSPLFVRPTHLVVPPSLLSAGKAIVEAQNLANGASNVWYKDTTLICTAALA